MWISYRMVVCSAVMYFVRHVDIHVRLITYSCIWRLPMLRSAPGRYLPVISISVRFGISFRFFSGRMDLPRLREALPPGQSPAPL